MFKVLIADSLPAAVLERYNSLEDISVDNKSGISAEELMEILPRYDALVVRSRTKVTKEIMERGPNLKIIGRAGAGVDNIDAPEATHRGIIVMNTPGGNTIAATEHTIALMLAALRQIPSANASIRSEKWDRKTYMGHEIFEKTVGVIGLGKIGREVAKRLAAFNARIIGYDPILTKEMADRLGVELVSLKDLLKQSDIITIHAPKIAETKNMLNAENLKTCKNGVVIVNCARGGIVNEHDLVDALNSGKVAAAAVDVYESEPPTYWELAKHPKVVSTPHLGAQTEEAQTKVADQIMAQIVEFARKNVALNAVNYISIDEKIQPLIAPYFTLAEKLGALFSQIRTGRLKEVAIRFYGKITELPDTPIASHLMAGALRSGGTAEATHAVELLNMVNSLAIAREKGINIEITRKDQPLTSYTNLIACDFHTETGMVHLAGTVYAAGIYRLVEFDKYDADVDLGGKMILIENDDVPGVIGNVGTVLGEHKINITNFSSRRVKAGKTAANILNVEGKWDRGLQAKLEALPHVKRVYLADIAE
ncbi:MAG: phosphoglycerate dehydrogenase [Calditrichaceae bacterium]|nr:phosphoglycerate dehydrogenase [Calditrichia bacterium]NUQ43186.1 phosphoglycerate dehydrogenase [Calditrichaceae bacterium]